MSYPAGVVVRFVNLPQIIDSSGAPVSGVLTITPSVSLKWDATDQLVLSEPISVPIVGGIASVSLPVIQSGFVLTNNVRVDAWTYSASLSLPAGVPEPAELLFALPYGTTSYDLDFDAPADVAGTILTLINNLPGDAGPAGPANTLTIGTVTTGSPAAATITGTSPNQVLNLTIPQGDPGAAGSATGVPVGGTALQYLRKVTSTDFDTEWATFVREIPVGGSAAQVLGKVSATDFDYAWITQSGSGGTSLPNGGTINQVLKKNSSTNGDASWADRAVDYAGLPAGTTITVQKAAGVWPVRPTARTDITVIWKGADPSPAIGGSYMVDNVDIRAVTI